MISIAGGYSQSTLALLEALQFTGRRFDGRYIVGRVVFVTFISGEAVQ